MANIYVGNLNYDATRQDVTDLFEQAGYAVTHINMAIDRETGRNRSFAFIEVPTEAEAIDAVSKLDGTSFMGRDLRVKPAERRAPSNQQSSQSPSRGGERGWRGAGSPAAGGSGTAPMGRSAQSDNWRTRVAPAASSSSPAPAANGTGHGSSDTSNSSSVYLGGIPLIASDSEAEAFVRKVMSAQGELRIKHVSRMFRPNADNNAGTDGTEEPQRRRSPHMYCFVEMESVEDASLAMVRCDGLEVEGGGRLKCNVSRGPRERQPQQQGEDGATTTRPPRGPGGGSGYRRGGGGYGRAPAFAQRADEQAA